MNIVDGVKKRPQEKNEQVTHIFNILLLRLAHDNKKLLLYTKS